MFCLSYLLLSSVDAHFNAAVAMKEGNRYRLLSDRELSELLDKAQLSSDRPNLVEDPLIALKEEANRANLTLRGTRQESGASHIVMPSTIVVQKIDDSLLPFVRVYDLALGIEKDKAGLFEQLKRIHIIPGEDGAPRFGLGGREGYEGRPGEAVLPGGRRIGAAGPSSEPTAPGRPADPRSPGIAGAAAPSSHAEKAVFIKEAAKEVYKFAKQIQLQVEARGQDFLRGRTLEDFEYSLERAVNDISIGLFGGHNNAGKYVKLNFDGKPAEETARGKAPIAPGGAPLPTQDVYVRVEDLALVEALLGHTTIVDKIDSHLFLVRQDDPRAAALRANEPHKIVPDGAVFFEDFVQRTPSREGVHQPVWQTLFYRLSKVQTPKPTTAGWEFTGEGQKGSYTPAIHENLSLGSFSSKGTQVTLPQDLANGDFALGIIDLEEDFMGATPFDMLDIDGKTLPSHNALLGDDHSGFPVPSGAEVAFTTAQIIRWLKPKGIIETRDNHPYTHISFPQNGGLFYTHCVYGTTGQKPHPYLAKALSWYYNGIGYDQGDGRSAAYPNNAYLLLNKGVINEHLSAIMQRFFIMEDPTRGGKLHERADRMTVAQMEAYLSKLQAERDIRKRQPKVVAFLEQAITKLQNGEDVTDDEGVMSKHLVREFVKQLDLKHGKVMPLVFTGLAGNFCVRGNVIDFAMMLADLDPATGPRKKPRSIYVVVDATRGVDGNLLGRIGGAVQSKQFDTISGIIDQELTRGKSFYAHHQRLAFNCLVEEIQSLKAQCEQELRARGVNPREDIRGISTTTRVPAEQQTALHKKTVDELKAIIAGLENIHLITSEQLLSLTRNPAARQGVADQQAWIHKVNHVLGIEQNEEETVAEKRNYSAPQGGIGQIRFSSIQAAR